MRARSAIACDALGAAPRARRASPAPAGLAARRRALPRPGHAVVELDDRVAHAGLRGAQPRRARRPRPRGRARPRIRAGAARRPRRTAAGSRSSCRAAAAADRRRTAGCRAPARGRARARGRVRHEVAARAVGDQRADLGEHARPLEQLLASEPGRAVVRWRPCAAGARAWRGMTPGSSAEVVLDDALGRSGGR